MDDLSRFCCLNSDCPELGKRGTGNLTVTSRYGSRKERPMLRCRVCKGRFSERKGTPLFDSRLPPETFEGTISRRIILRGQSFPQFLRRELEELPEAQVVQLQAQQTVRRLVLAEAGPKTAQVPVQTLQVQ